MSWGGKREGAGRKTGWRKDPEKILRRKTRTLAAFDDEWELIKKFSQVVKYGDKQKCIELLNALE